jgi:hypothetical protein
VETATSGADLQRKIKMINDASIVRIERQVFDASSVVVSGGVGVPVGGSQGQVLAKSTSSNYDTAWVDPTLGVPQGGTEGQFLVKNSNNNYDTKWENFPYAQSTEYLLQTVHNDSGLTINKGSVVYFANGYLSYPVVYAALANSVHDSAVIGLALDNILNNDYGTIIVNGIIEGVNTNDFNPGEKLYLSTTISGGITNIEPEAPNHRIMVGFCIKKGINDGVIYVNINPGTHLEWLHDVKLDSPSSGDFLFLTENGFWINKKINNSDVSGSLSLSDLSGYYPVNNPSGFITGIDLSNYAENSDIFNSAVEWTVNHTLADGTRYLAGDLVYSSGKVYKANYDNESIPVTDSLYWTDLGLGYRLNIDGRDIPNIPQVDTSNFYTNDNPSGFITGIDTSNFYTNDNPSGFITGIDTSNFYTDDNPSGFITGIDTSNFYTNDNPSGFITGIDTSSFITGIGNVVYTTGNQIVSGLKSFADGFEAGAASAGLSTLFVSGNSVGINNENPSGALDVSGASYFSQRPVVTGLQVLLSGDIDTSNFYTNDNLSGFITGIDTSNFYTNDNPSGFVPSLTLLNYVNKSGDTMTGKLNLPASTAASAGINLGVGAVPTSPVVGDLIATNSRLYFQESPTSQRIIAYTNSSNNFNNVQSIDASTSTTLFRVTQRGTGDAFRVEDSPNPDFTPFVINQYGAVAIGGDIASDPLFDGTRLKVSGNASFDAIQSEPANNLTFFEGYNSNYKKFAYFGSGGLVDFLGGQDGVSKNTVVANFSTGAITAENYDQGSSVTVQGNSVAEIAYDGSAFSIQSQKALFPTDGGEAYYGQVSRITSGVINIATAGAYQSTGLTATLDSENIGVSLGTTDLFAVKNTSGSAQLLKIYGSADIDAGNNTVLGIKLALNGTPIDNTECNASTGQGTTFAKLVTNWMIELQPNDEVALFVTNKSTSGNVTLLRGRLVASTVGKQGIQGPEGPQGPSVDLSGYIESDSSVAAGAGQIINIISISQADYDAIVTPDPSTLYVII